MLTRREWLCLLPVLVFSVATRRSTIHPTPRPGITAARVLASEQLPPDQELRAVFRMVREIPQIVDGIYCYCGCAEIEGQYSLLSCYEADGMAQSCHICQGEGRMAYRMHEQGASLTEIRRAIDRNFG